tara:strand:- start:21 stop:1088 length:1068 start_codon:yes stop_codon:yes gene_type:complete
MPTLKQKFIVQKVKNNQTQTDKVNNFPKLSELYLELLINKDNIIESKKNYNENYNENYNDSSYNKVNLDNENYKSDYKSDYNYSESNYSDSASDSDYSDDSDDSRSKYSDSSSSSDDSNLSIRLKNLLKDDGNDINLDNINQKTEYIAPSLNDLEKRGEIEPKMNIPNINNNFINEEEEEDKKRELLFKFELLKKSYKNTEIPELTIHTDLKTIERTYEDVLKRVNIESNVESYRNYLIGGFMVVEYGLGHFLKFDMKGFTQQQMVSMNKYNKLLIELGEKTYKPKAKKMSVELRLLFLILFNAATFVISKMILKGTGSDLMGMLNKLGDKAGGVSPLKKRKMRGPQVEVEDLPN